MCFTEVINRGCRLPLKEAISLIENYLKENKRTYFSEQQRLLDMLERKNYLNKSCDSTYFMRALAYLKLMENNQMKSNDLDILAEFPLFIWIEVISELNDQEILKILDYYMYKLSKTPILEIFLLNLSDEKQVEALEKYKHCINSETESLISFYNSLNSLGQKKLVSLYPDIWKTNILNILESDEENKIVETLEKYKGQLRNEDTDNIIETILTRSSDNKLFEKVIELFSDRIYEMPNTTFYLLFKVYYSKAEGNELELFELFKNKFDNLGLKVTLDLFNIKAYSDSNPLLEKILYYFKETTYVSKDLDEYINKDILDNLRTKYYKECLTKQYSIDDFRLYISDIEHSSTDKLFNDDYIKTFIACRNLMEQNIINKNSGEFIKFRELFINKIMSKLEKDGTYNEQYSLNGLFYRIVKGSVDFNTIYNIHTYRGLIYLVRTNEQGDCDYITQYLTDNLVARINLKPLLGWKKDNNSSIVSVHYQKMGLQLLSYFGKDKAKYILNSNMRINRMENIFADLNYSSIILDENGEPLVNNDLLEFLFGRGKSNEFNSTMNKLIRQEIPYIEKFFSDLCNNFVTIKKALKDILTIKRIEHYYDMVTLPINLQKHQYHYLNAIREMNTTNPELLMKGIELCDLASTRKYSTIPKVKGQLGKFSYEILDLDDPFALAIGYLSHCCFTVNGESKKALEHSMASINGRSFVVYYENKFLAQSWIWRNGDVVCFDSVEAGSSRFGAYEDNYKLVDVYKFVANNIYQISKEKEDEIQRVKVVTVGKSDFKFNDLIEIENNVPKPLETNLYVYDSDRQYILAGQMPKKIRYDIVGIKYKDKRKPVKYFSDISRLNIDEKDELSLKLNFVKYHIDQTYFDRDINEYNECAIGQDWYILIDKSGNVESVNSISDEEGIKEYKQYAEILRITYDKYNLNINNIKTLKLTRKGQE